MRDDTLAVPSATPVSRVDGPRSGPLDSVLLKTLDGVLRRNAIGRLQITMPSGLQSTVGDPTQPLGPEIAFRTYRAFWRLMSRGALGFAEAYMDADIDVADLRAVFDFYTQHEAAITRAFPRLNDTRRRDRQYHFRRSNTIAGSRRNIADHYDLGNAFYSLWLDPTLLYSSGIYRSDESSLEDAQQEKLARILESLELADGTKLLEIGCGWGALAEAAARHGANVTAITISEQQLATARKRIASAGLEQQAKICFEDYRNTRGSFDRIVSIEMIEAVGEENWPLFFKTLSERLTPGGSAVVQAITIRDDMFDQYKRNPDFIQRYIFPGGMLPTVELMQERAVNVGMTFETIERFGLSYARTLSDWRERFLAAWPQIAALGFDERFKRMWLYYLIYCEVGFEQGQIDVGLYRLCKPA